ncbi:BMP family ABC transporter substrate-binding protein [Eubacterium sp. An11]|nr:BMP family ABC transporter substrate-binding protein [Eubacterium sp. An11]
MNYEKACHLGKKEGGSPAVLDTILEERHITAPAEVSLGLVSIPVDRIVGTKSKGRSQSFSKSFYPVLKENTEFASKWISLCNAHLNEGIREPIKAYEFMNEFYVEEGNKRVSVLKYFGAVSIPANVIRIIPPQSDDKETRIYYEFMDFYSLSEINDIWFSRPGSFARLQRLVGKMPNEPWSNEDRKTFHSSYALFQKAFEALDEKKTSLIPGTTVLNSLENSAEKKKSSVLPGDAFLYYIDLYGYDSLQTDSAAELKKKLKKTRDEFQLLQSDQSVALQMDPGESKKKNLLLRLIPAGTKKLRVCFIYARTVYTSSWSYAHDLGRAHLQQAFSDQVTTSYYENGTLENIAGLLQKAIDAGNDLIFTTSPIFLKESLKAAIDHPEVKILNCSLNTSHKHIRTYYARMHEAKFLMGAIAGAMAENDKIGYVADYPIYGNIASINAFALGAQMVNPRATVYLEWSRRTHPVKKTFFADHDISVISGKDSTAPGMYDQQFGLYCPDGDSIWNMAMPVWNWGRFYEQMIRNVMNGSWKLDDEKDTTKGLNYWWGMSSGIVDVICSHRLPIGTSRLIALLKETICRGDFNPFSGIMYSQNGVVKGQSSDALTSEEIITMDWLAQNIVGSIPSKDDLDEPARDLAAVQGVKEEDRLP